MHISTQHLPEFPNTKSQHTGIWDFGSWGKVKDYNCSEIRGGWMKEGCKYKHTAYKEVRIC